MTLNDLSPCPTPCFSPTLGSCILLQRTSMPVTFSFPHDFIILSPPDTFIDLRYPLQHFKKLPPLLPTLLSCLKSETELSFFEGHSYKKSTMHCNHIQLVQESTKILLITILQKSIKILLQKELFLYYKTAVGRNNSQ